MKPRATPSKVKSLTHQITFTCVLWILFWSATTHHGQPAFPQAEGAGAFAKGGRGGDVYYVTNLYDYTSSSDPNRFGTLRYGIASATGPRTILFAVSGYIDLKSRLTINKTNITIAGQTAPGDGICLRNYTLEISANDVVVRHIRVRLGTNALQEADSVWITGGRRIIVDHCSTSWSVDETFSATGSPQDLTVQWCFITESLNNSIHSKGAHGYGSLLTPNSPTIWSWHHNLYAHHNSRSPRVGSQVPNLLWTLDFRNNVIYNWGNRAGYSGDTNEFARINYVANALIAGPNKAYNYAFQGGGTTTWIFQEHNIIDLTLDGRFNPTNNGWGMFSGSYTPTNKAFDTPPITTDTPSNALLKVLVFGGALPWRRDSLDTRIAHNVFSSTGSIIDFPDQAGGWPTLASEPAPTDTDKDGMPDYWELAMGLNPSNPNDRNLTNALGYTMLEEYLDWKAVHHALCDRNGKTTLNLRKMFGGLTNLDYLISPGSNCTVSLKSDGYTAEFIAARKYSGLANFSVTVTNRAWQIAAGPFPVRVLITTTNALNSNPIINPIPDLHAFAGHTVSNACVAYDSDIPAQNLTFSLIDPPSGATIDPCTGMFTWQIPVSWPPSTNLITVQVTDDGEPPASATQTFKVIVLPIPQPILTSYRISGGEIGISFTAVVPGLAYHIQTSTNLTHWETILVTNPPNTEGTFSIPLDRNTAARFYRIAIFL